MSKLTHIDKSKVVTRCFAVKDFRAVSVNADGGNDGENTISGHAAVFY